MVNPEDMHPAFLVATKLGRWLEDPTALPASDVWHPALAPSVDLDSEAIERLRGWFRTGGLAEHPELLDDSWARVWLVHDVGEPTSYKAGDALPGWAISLLHIPDAGWRVVFVGQRLTVEELDRLVADAGLRSGEP